MSLKKTSKDLLADAIKELMQHRELKASALRTSSS